MLDYIIKVLIFQTLFLAIYDLFLKRETFFQWNRVYLILTSILAYIIPLLKVNRVSEIIPEDYIILLPEVVLSPTATIEQKLQEPEVVFNFVQFIFVVGIILAASLFLFKLLRIIQLIYNNEKERKKHYFLVFLKNSSAFSFFNYIFLGKAISDKSKQQVIEHELIHVQQKHSIDLLVFELQKIVCWFNPFSYIYQHRISELHEFIADSKAIIEKDKTSYFNKLLSETFGVQNISFINPFFKHSLIKKRIVMLHKNKSKQVLKLKYLLLIPVLLSMLVYTSCEKSETIIEGKPSEGLLKQKSEDLKLIEARLNKLFDELGKSTKLTDEQSKRVQEVKEELYLYLVKKREESFISKDISSVPLSEIELAKGVPFAIIDQTPVFPGCEDAIDQKKCLQESISNHIAQNFDKSIAKPLALEAGKKKIYVQFTIDKNGMITDAKARGPHEALEEEAMKAINELPKMQPGKQNGKKVDVKYTLPISFEVE